MKNDYQILISKAFSFSAGPIIVLVQTDSWVLDGH